MPAHDKTASDQFDIGLALGGGAVKGLAHIGLLKLLDKHKLKPSHISGTSMGAIIGALYAVGLSGLDIENRVKEYLVGSGKKSANIYKRSNQLFKWMKIFRYEKNQGGLVTAEGLFTHFFDELNDIEFDDLNCNFSCSATDFNRGAEVALRHGKVLEAVQASMAVPGVFAPVYKRIDDTQTCLVDGGLVNNLPTNHIQESDFLIASDVISVPNNRKPKTLEAANGAVNIMLHYATARALEQCPVDILHTIDTNGIEAFDFHKIDDVLTLGDDAAIALEPRLLKALKTK